MFLLRVFSFLYLYPKTDVKDQKDGMLKSNIGEKRQWNLTEHHKWIMSKMLPTNGGG